MPLKNAVKTSRSSGECTFRSISLGKVQVSTLRAVHELGIIHCDVKSENIVTPMDQAFYLTDWVGKRVGTPCTSLRVLK